MIPMAIALCFASLSALDLDSARELPWREYVDSQIARVDDRVLPPPPDMAVYFGKHSEALDSVRSHPQAPANRSAHIVLTRILVAHALSHHDWADLHAAWQLQKSLWAKRDL